MFTQVATLLENLILNFLNTHQLFASSLLLFIEEAGIPIPVPGDIIIAFIGFKFSLGHLNIFETFFSLLFSIILGSTVLYTISRTLGKTMLLKLSRYIGINEEKYNLIEKEFKKFGVFVIIFGRHIPGFRIPITIFSGIFQIGYIKFISSVTLTASLWIIFYLWVGKTLGKETITILHNHHGLQLFFLVPFGVLALYLFFRFRKFSLKLSNPPDFSNGLLNSKLYLITSYGFPYVP